jgi:hypothetical protein
MRSSRLAVARNVSPPRPRMCAAPGAVAEWLRSGLQSRVHRFDSGRRLYEARREHLKPHGRGRDSAHRAGLATLADRYLSEVSMQVEADRSAHQHLLDDDDRKTGGQDDTYGFALTAHPGKSQGRPVTPTGSQPIGTARPARPAFSQSPCPRTPATRRTGPDGHPQQLRAHSHTGTPRYGTRPRCRLRSYSAASVQLHQAVFIW